MTENTDTRQRALTDYLNKLKNMIKIKKPELSDEKIEEEARKYIIEKIKPVEAEVSGERMNAETIMKYSQVGNTIITGSGSIYLPQSQKKNLNAEMLKDFIDSRKVAKANQFKYKGVDDTLFHKYMNEQKTIKILANSYYGAMIQKNSIFFNPYSGPAITYTGVDIVTTSAIALEQFIGGNIFFMNIEEIYNYILRIYEEEYKNHDLKIHSVPSDKAIIDKLVNCVEEKYTQEQYDKLLNFFKLFDQDNKNKVFFKNNLNGLIDHTDIFDNKISKLTGRDDFLDPNEPPEDMIEGLDELFDILLDWVVYNYQDYNRMYRMNYKPRNSVLTVK